MREPEDGGDSADIACIVFSAFVTQASAESLLDTLSQCATEGFSEVHLVLSTPGGSVDAGINLYNVLRGMPFRLVTQNAGDVASIGVAIYVAGDDRTACPDARFLLHGVSETPPPNQAFGAEWFLERHESILAQEARINTILANRTSLTAEQLEAHRGKERQIDARTAVSEGIAHRIEDVHIPPGAHVFTVPTS